MKKILSLALALVCLSAWGQEGPIAKITERFSDPEKGSPVFVQKGYRAIGISAGFRSFKVGGDSVVDGDGFSVLSVLNIGNGLLNTYSVAPRFSFFIANDVSLGGRLEYTGYNLSSDLSVFGFPVLDWKLNNNTWALSFTARRYLSFFGSKTFGLFGEARLYGKYGFTNSTPFLTNDADAVTGKFPRPDLPAGERYLAMDQSRHTDIWGVGIKLAVGLAVKLKDNSCISVSLPLVGIGYNYSHQIDYKTGNKSHTSNFQLTRQIEFLALQVGYSHFIKSKKK